MKKFISLSTIALAILCISGNGHFADALVYAESSVLVTMFLAGVIVLLVTLLIVNPPRPKSLRITAAAAGAVLGMLSTYALLSYQINILEWVIYFETAIVLLIEAFEIETSKVMVPRKKTQLSIQPTA